MEKKGLSLALLRMALGLLFLVQGLGKLMNPAGITGMLSGLGFPIANVFAWILLLSEIIFGLSLVIGYKTKIAVWPLFIVLLVALILVVIPSIEVSNPGSYMGLGWHLIGLTGLMNIRAFGPGRLFS